MSYKFNITERRTFTCDCCGNAWTFDGTSNFGDDRCPPGMVHFAAAGCGDADVCASCKRLPLAEVIDAVADAYLARQGIAKSADDEAEQVTAHAS